MGTGDSNSRRWTCGRLYLTLGVLIIGGLVISFVTSCEMDGDRSLSVVPKESMIGPNIASMSLAVLDGTRDLSLPLEWRVANPDLGYVAQDLGLYVVYIRSTQHGVNTITVRDQYGSEGVAVIAQVSYTTERPTTPTIYESGAGSTNSNGTASSSDMSASASGNRAIIKKLWSDGSNFTTEPFVYGVSSTTVQVSGGSGLPDETHDLAFSNVTWENSTTISGFTVVVDGSASLTYP